jgi:hypothetical protein
MNDEREATPTSTASVVGATDADLASSVSAFFAKFPVDGAQPVDRLPASRFFDVVLGTGTTSD